MYNLGKNVKVAVVSNTEAAGSTDVNTTEIDMQGWDGVMWIAVFGAITSGAATGVHAQQDTVTGMGSAADLLGTSISIDDDEDDMALVLDLYRPEERFVRCVVDRATQNAVVEAVLAIQYRGKKAPSVHCATTVADSEVHVSPAEGTA